MRTILSILFTIFLFSSFKAVRFASCEAWDKFANISLEATPSTKCYGFMGFPVAAAEENTVIRFKLKSSPEQMILLNNFIHTTSQINDDNTADVLKTLKTLRKMLSKSSAKYEGYIAAITDYKNAFQKLSEASQNKLEDALK